MNSAECFADLYKRLENAYNAAIMLNQPMLAMQYAVQMRTMETANVLQEPKKETVH